MTQVNLPDTFSTTIAKTGRVVTLETALLPDSSIEFIFQYGLDQKSADASASLTRKGANPFTGTDAEFKSAVDATTDEFVERAYAGTLGTRVKIDPTVVMLRELQRITGRKWTVEEVAGMTEHSEAVLAETPKKRKSA